MFGVFAFVVRFVWALVSVVRSVWNMILRISCLLWKCILVPVGRMPMLILCGLRLSTSMQVGR